MYGATTRINRANGQTDRINGWTIDAHSDGRRFTNDRSDHGMFVSIDNTYSFRFPAIPLAGLCKAPVDPTADEDGSSVSKLFRPGQAQHRVIQRQLHSALCASASHAEKACPIS